ncbi:MAG: transposase [Gemmatimonadales bacterium]
MGAGKHADHRGGRAAGTRGRRRSGGGATDDGAGHGPVTAVACVATLDDVTRFVSAHQVAAYLGLTPREYSSVEQQRRGRESQGKALPIG